MIRLFSYAFAIAVGLGAAAAVASGHQPASGSTSGNFHYATEASFRDGLHLGRLTAQQGGPMHIASGRWATAADRRLFVAGFQEGYYELNAGQAPLIRVRRAQ